MSHVLKGLLPPQGRGRTGGSPGTLLLLPGLQREAVKQKSTLDKTRNYTEALQPAQNSEPLEALDSSNPAHENLCGQLTWDGESLLHLTSPEETRAGNFTQKHTL